MSTHDHATTRRKARSQPLWQACAGWLRLQRAQPLAASDQQAPASIPPSVPWWEGDGIALPPTPPADRTALVPTEHASEFRAWVARHPDLVERLGSMRRWYRPESLAWYQAEFCEVMDVAPIDTDLLRSLLAAAADEDAAGTQAAQPCEMPEDAVIAPPPSPRRAKRANQGPAKTASPQSPVTALSHDETVLAFVRRYHADNHYVPSIATTQRHLQLPRQTTTRLLHKAILTLDLQPKAPKLKPDVLATQSTLFEYAKAA
jgi:hypothetical protein